MSLSDPAATEGLQHVTVQLCNKKLTLREMTADNRYHAFIYKTPSFIDVSKIPAWPNSHAMLPRSRELIESMEEPTLAKITYYADNSTIVDPYDPSRAHWMTINPSSPSRVTWTGTGESPIRLKNLPQYRGYFTITQSDERIKDKSGFLFGTIAIFPPPGKDTFRAEADGVEELCVTLSP